MTSVRGLVRRLLRLRGSVDVAVQVTLALAADQARLQADTLDDLFGIGDTVLMAGARREQDARM